MHHIMFDMSLPPEKMEKTAHQLDELSGSEVCNIVSVSVLLSCVYLYFVRPLPRCQRIVNLIVKKDV